MGDMGIETPYGRRDKRSGRIRLVGGLVLCLVFLLLDLTVGGRQQAEHLEALASKAPEGWAVNRFKDPVDHLPIPPKKDGVKRFIYISNSHAKTGGHVARHLQRFLDGLAPDAYEVLDLADAGIFAPDMLQRLLAGMEYEPDAVLLPVAYISFSDRMKLSRQSWSARSFFKWPVFHRLPAGFWWRNYDLSLYGDTLTARFLPLYRYRNDIRDIWEKPLTGYLKDLTGDHAIRSLEVDENQGWKFPEGFDRNLFDWSLYAIGREGHLADLAAMADACRERDLPLLAFNLPVHWQKEPREVDMEDVAAYRRSLERIFSTARLYTDYQDTFPKEFTTYDALHPTWHGARLHALDLVLKLNRLGLLWKTYDETEIVDIFLEADQAVSPEYRQALNGGYQPNKEHGFLRYDLFDPDNARTLLRQLASCTINTKEERDTLQALSRRIRYWRLMSFDVPIDARDPSSASFHRALVAEIERARERVLYFENELVRFEEERLADYPIPSLEGAVYDSRRVLYKSKAFNVIGEVYQTPDGGHVVENHESRRNRIISYYVFNPKANKAFLRSDILENGSYILFETYTKSLYLPFWIDEDIPEADWGI